MMFIHNLAEWNNVYFSEILYITSLNLGTFNQLFLQVIFQYRLFFLLPWNSEDTNTRYFITGPQGAVGSCQAAPSVLQTGHSPLSRLPATESS